MYSRLFILYGLILTITEQIEEPVTLTENHNNTLQQFYGEDVISNNFTGKPVLEKEESDNSFFADGMLDRIESNIVVHGKGYVLTMGDRTQVCLPVWIRNIGICYFTAS
ncbi:PREDICTED: uncharacterized protein LOC107172463 [Diuraphis noxia]|uniref:uncharacterized protein LOC107172463 n=1 Tax=Diuraphis noxia TaxID=143948 RepID=UPI0007638FBC|nr:PREDICTED: uncharacterized protein LOC107172463 [Diuraphis noxia]